MSTSITDPFSLPFIPAENPLTRLHQSDSDRARPLDGADGQAGRPGAGCAGRSASLLRTNTCSPTSA